MGPVETWKQSSLLMEDCGPRARQQDSRGNPTSVIWVSPLYLKCSRPIISSRQRQDDSNNFHRKVAINIPIHGGLSLEEQWPKKKATINLSDKPAGPSN